MKQFVIWLVCVPWLIHRRDMIHAHVWHDSCIHVTQLPHERPLGCTYIYSHTLVPRTEEIGLKIITTANISNTFSRESPYIWNTFSRESPTFQSGFLVSKRSENRPILRSNHLKSGLFREWLSATAARDSCRTHIWVMSCIWTIHVTHIGIATASFNRVSRVTCMNESCRTHVQAMSCIWMSHVTHMRVTTQATTWTIDSMSHVTRINESCPTYEGVMSHIWTRYITHTRGITRATTWTTDSMSHVTRMNESCPTYEWVMSHIMNKSRHTYRSYHASYHWDV